LKQAGIHSKFSINFRAVAVRNAGCKIEEMAHFGTLKATGDSEIA
jgi:hypothetical protein